MRGQAPPSHHPTPSDCCLTPQLPEHFHVSCRLFVSNGKEKTNLQSDTVKHSQVWLFAAMAYLVISLQTSLRTFTVICMKITCVFEEADLRARLYFLERF